MAAGKCEKCGFTWSQYQNGGHHCPADNVALSETERVQKQTNAEWLAEYSKA